MKNWDVIVVGGGIIGLSIAISLRKKGAAVLLVERGEPGREASSAAGGMLVDYPPETPKALQPLASASAAMYPEFVRELELESKMKVDLREQGTILLPAAGHAQSEGALSRSQLNELEPELTIEVHGALILRERSVDPRAVVKAAIQAAKNRCVHFSSGDPVTAVSISDGKVSGVTTTKTSFFAPKVVNCAGAWSGTIGPEVLPTRPVKGQMLCLAMPSRNTLQHVVRSPQAYLIPRSDGRLLVGATVEEAGFDKRTVASTIQRLHEAALELVPALRDAKILEDWAGLRPGSPDALPILDATPTPGYYVASGHFRDGILLAPITGQVMAEVINGESPAQNLSAFSLQRFAASRIAS